MNEINEIDPDRWRDGMLCDGVPEPLPGWRDHLREQRSPTRDERVKRLRDRVTRLWTRLAELTPDAPPETLREVEDEQLEALCRWLEQRIAVAMGKT